LIQERHHATPLSPAKSQNTLPTPQFYGSLIQTSRNLHNPSGSAPVARKRSLVNNFAEFQGGFREKYFESLDNGLPKVGNET